MDWSILGIEPTKDKKAITAAYRQQLRVTNPEDKPEDFKALRAAYEEALVLAEQQEAAPEADGSPVGKWLGEVAAVYNNLESRIDPEKWRALFCADVCYGLDTRPAVEEALLKFLMEQYYLPKPVWQLMEENFHFAERLDELKESYPADFLENVIYNGLRLEPSLPYGLFSPGKNGADCDRYIQLYFEANQTGFDEQEEILGKIEALSEYHPYGHLLRINREIINGDPDKGLAALRELSGKYPQDAHIRLTLASGCLEYNNIEEAEAVAQSVLDEMSASNPAKAILARCLAAKGDYQKAKELIFENILSCDGDPILINHYAEQIRSWNEQVIPQREAKLAEAPEDMDNLIELAWCYIQNERQEDAEDTIGKIREDGSEPYKYHNLMAKFYHNAQDYDKAMPHLRVTEALIRQMVPDGTEETRKRMERLPEVLQLQGNCLMQLGENVEAREKFEEALRLAPDDVEILLLMGKILYATGDHEYAVEILEQINVLSPGKWYSNLLLALAYYRLQLDREAYAAINRAMSTQVRDLSLYLTKIQILIRNGVWDEVHGILDYLQEADAPEDLSLEFMKAQLTELEEQDMKAAFAQYQKIARRMEAGEPMMWSSELYYRMAYLMSDSMDMDKEEDRELLLTMLDKGLAQYQHDPQCLNYKAWVLQRGGKIQEAIAVYKGLLEKNRRSTIARQGLIRMYSNHLDTCAQEAMAFYEEQLAENRTAEMYFFAAECKWHLGDLEAARRYFLLSMEMDPDDVDAYNGLAYLCDAQGRYEESLAHIEQGMEAAARGEGAFVTLYRHKVMVLRRLGKMAEALEAASQLEQYGAEEMYQLKFDICCQFGDWEQAGLLLKEWKKRVPGSSGWAKAKGQLYLLRGKPFLGSVSMTFTGKRLSGDEIEDFQMQTQSLIGGYDLIVRTLKRRAKVNPKDDHVLLGLASALREGGKEQESRKVAEKALKLLDETLQGNLLDEALFRCRRSKALALLGRIDEAKVEVKNARKLPLCDYCPYGSCKDADIFEAEIEELLGNRKAALELFRAGRAKWPDDLDFVAGEGRIKRKGL